MRRVFVFLVVGLLAAGPAFCLDMPAQVADACGICPGGTVIQVTAVGGSDVVVVECSGSLADVYRDYRGRAQANGWQIVHQTEMADSMVFMAQKGTSQLTVAGTAQDGKTMFSLTLTSQ